MEKETLEQRMYHLVLYNLSPIQQGIQAYHSGIEYGLRYGNKKSFNKWAEVDKTVIILNGGGYSALCQHTETLTDNNIKIAGFYEPDLNGTLTSIAFLVNEKVWNKEKYPDPESNKFIEYTENEFTRLEKMYGTKSAFLRTFLKQFRLA